MIPEWAEKYRKPGTTIKKIGNGYYLYSATFKTVEGKKYPVSVQSYLGRITEDGLIGARKHIRISSLQAKRLGDLIPGIDGEFADIILLEYQKEWYFTKIPAAKVKKLMDIGLYKNELILRTLKNSGLPEIKLLLASENEFSSFQAAC